MKTEKIGADTATLAGLQIDLLQKIRSESGQITLEHLKWFIRLTKEQRDKFIGNSIDGRFKLLNTFKLKVPEDYEHGSQLASFKRNNRAKFWGYNDNITDGNFAKVTDKLMLGETYEGRVYQITEIVNSEGILAFLRAQPGNRFFGAQGLSALGECNKEKFPIGKWTIAIDQKDALWKDAGGSLGGPVVYRDSGGDWHFSLVSFEGAWGDGYCVLCFCDLPK